MSSINEGPKTSFDVLKVFVNTGPSPTTESIAADQAKAAAKAKMNSSAVVQTEQKSASNPVREGVSNFVRDPLTPLLQGGGKVLQGVGSFGVICLLPMAAASAGISEGLIAAGKHLGLLDKPDDKGQMSAGSQKIAMGAAIVGTLGFAALAMLGKKMQAEAKERNMPKEPREGRINDFIQQQNAKDREDPYGPGAYDFPPEASEEKPVLAKPGEKINLAEQLPDEENPFDQKNVKPKPTINLGALPDDDEYNFNQPIERQQPKATERAEQSPVGNQKNLPPATFKSVMKNIENGSTEGFDRLKLPEQKKVLQNLTAEFNRGVEKQNLQKINMLLDKSNPVGELFHQICFTGKNATFLGPEIQFGMKLYSAVQDPTNQEKLDAVKQELDLANRTANLNPMQEHFIQQATINDGGANLTKALNGQQREYIGQIGFSAFMGGNLSSSINDYQPNP